MIEPPLIDALIALQLFVVVFVALHDWVQLGTLNNLSAVEQSDPTYKLILVTAVSTFPFAVGCAATIYYARATFPGWLMWWLRISYGVAAYGMLRTWWIPYLLFKEPTRIARYQTRFAGTHAFLPVHNGIRPDTLHCILHSVIIAILVLLCVGSI
jgi:hypothetical protein